MHGLGAKLRKLAGQAKICTPPGGEVIAKICVPGSIHTQYNSRLRLRYGRVISYMSHFSSRRLAAAATFHIGNFVAAAVNFGFLLLFLSPPLPATSSSSSSLCENLHSPPREMVQLLRKYALETSPVAALRKYALRQNHTIPVYPHATRPLTPPRARHTDAGPLYK